MESLPQRPIPLVVIEKDEQVTKEMEEKNVLYLYMDVTSEGALTEAGIKRARGLVSVFSSDPENVYISLTARGLNTKIYIVSRADDESTEKKLFQAWANKVFLPCRFGGRRMAQAIIMPTVSNFLDSAVHDRTYGLNIEEITVGDTSYLNNLTLVDSGLRQELDVIIIDGRDRQILEIVKPLI